MTFQVGIVGSDGVILASDLREIRQEELRTTSETTKIIWDGDLIACCSAGGRWSENAASLCVRRFNRQTPIKNQMSEACRSALSNCNSVGQRLLDFHGTVLLVHSDGSSVGLYSAAVQADSFQNDWEPSRVKPIYSYEWIGDFRSSTVYILERYLGADPWTNRPIDKITFVAAHAVLMAAKLNPGGVRGLEMLMCRPTGFEKVTQREIAELTERSSDLDADIASHLFS